VTEVFLTHTGMYLLPIARFSIFVVVSLHLYAALLNLWRRQRDRREPLVESLYAVWENVFLLGMLLYYADQLFFHPVESPTRWDVIMINTLLAGYLMGSLLHRKRRRDD